MSGRRIQIGTDGTMQIQSPSIAPDVFGDVTLAPFAMTKRT